MIGYKVQAQARNPYTAFFPELTENLAISVMALADPKLASTQQLSWPQQCCCCTDDSDTFMNVSSRNIYPTGNRLQVSESSWHVPYCEACKRHVEAKSTITISVISFGVAAICGSAILATAILKGLEPGELLFPIVILLLIFTIAATLLVSGFALRHLGRSRKQHCSAKGLAASYLGENRFIHTFVFANRKYAEAFAAANGTKLDGEVPW
jgi:hypothetical protein